jgi:hypothetical protein
MNKLKKYLNDSFIAKESLLKKETEIKQAIKKISTSIKKRWNYIFLWQWRLSSRCSTLNS